MFLLPNSQSPLRLPIRDSAMISLRFHHPPPSPLESQNPTCSRLSLCCRPLAACIAADTSVSPLESQSPNPCSRVSVCSRPLAAGIAADTSVSGGNAGLRFREKLLFLERDLGVDASRALSLNPSLRSTPISSLRSVTALLASFGLLPSDISRLLTLHPCLLTDDPSARILPVFNFLLGPASIPFPYLRISVNRCPRLLLSSVPDRLLPSLNFLRRLGFVGHHRITARTTVLLTSDVENTLIPKIDFIQSIGFSYQETGKMVLRLPALLTFSIDKNFRPKVEFLLGEMGREIGELKEFPQYFAFSLERRIKPRHLILVERGFGSSSISLGEMLKASDGEFQERLLELRLNSVGEKL